MTDRELMGLHAEIMSLRDILGISYKDACYRLHMAKWEKLKTDDRTHKAFALLSNQTRQFLRIFQARLGELGREGNSVVGSNNANANDIRPQTAPVQ